MFAKVKMLLVVDVLMFTITNANVFKTSFSRKFAWQVMSLRQPSFDRQLDQIVLMITFYFVKLLFSIFTFLFFF